MNSSGLETQYDVGHLPAIGEAAGKLVLNCSGGLGNQLFMYAAGVYFARRFGRSLELVKPDAGRQSFGGYQRSFQLNRFQIDEPVREAGALDRIFFSRNEKIRRWRHPIARSFGSEVIEERC